MLLLFYKECNINSSKPLFHSIIADVIVVPEMREASSMGMPVCFQ